MKSFLLSIISLVIFLNYSIAQFPSSKMIVLVKAGKLKMNKKEVSKEWKLSTFTASLDTFSRKKDGANRVHTYDNFGIILFEPAPKKMPAGSVAEFQIILDEIEPSTITPKSFYEGKLTIEKMDFVRSTSIEEIRKKLTDYKEIDTDENEKYRFAKDGIYIYFLYNKYKKLSKITFGKDKLTQKN